MPFTGRFCEIRLHLWGGSRPKMAQVSGRFDVCVERYGEAVIVKERTLGGYDHYGNPVWIFTEVSNEKAVITPLRGDEKMVQAGELQVGDAVGYFKTDSKVAVGYRIAAAGVEYQVLTVDKRYLKDNLSHLEAKLRRVTE